MCSKISNIFIGLKKTCLGVLDRGDTWQRQWNRFERGRRNRNVNYSASITRCTLSSAFDLLTILLSYSIFKRAAPFSYIFRSGISVSFHILANVVMTCDALMPTRFWTSLRLWSQNNKYDVLGRFGLLGC